MNNKIAEISINEDAKIIECLKLMDAKKVKLLLVFVGSKFKGLISIGDIQRAIINQVPLNSPISNILRKDITVAYDTENFESIKSKMLQFRTECMPVVNSANELIDVHFWEDIFHPSETRIQKKMVLPVVIMAGGKGTRLKPLTNILPKPLIPIGEKTIVEVIIDNFHKYGAVDFYLSVNYKHELIKFYLEGIENKDLHFHYFQETKPLGTAGSLFLLKNIIHSTFFVSNCDILIEDDYQEIYKYHKENNNQITIVASLKHIKIPYGIVEFGANGELKGLQEKPELTYMINTGMYVLEPEVLNLIPENKFYHITELIQDLKEQGKKVGIFPVSEKSWFDIGEWKEYKKVIDHYNADI